MESQLWDEYSQLVDLYKFYLGLILQANIFAFGIIGAIITLLCGDASSYLTKYGLVVPFFLCVALATIFLRSKTPARELEEAISKLGTELKTKLPPHTYLLRHAILLFGVVHILIAAGLIALFAIIS